MTTCSISPLRQRMMEDMSARKLSTGTQKGHLRACRRFAAFLKRSPDTASSEDIRRFQLHLAQSDISISKRNRTMTGLRFLFRVTLRRLDLAADIYHIREPQKIPLVISTDEAKRLLAVAKTLRLRVLLSLAYGCGLRAGEVVRLRVGDIDSAQPTERIVEIAHRLSQSVDLLGLDQRLALGCQSPLDHGVQQLRFILGHLIGRHRCIRCGLRLDRSPRPVQLLFQPFELPVVQALAHGPSLLVAVEDIGWHLRR